jgi:small subunit ribosomal protein S2
MTGVITSQLINDNDLPDKAPEYDLRDLLEAGMHFGHQKAKWFPRMAEWIYMEKDGVHIFDLEKTSAQLQLAYNYAYQLGLQGKTLVIIGTKRQASKIVEEVAREHGLMYITSRWLGGLLTNWEQVKNSLNRMLELEKGLETGKYAGYTKYEQVQLEKELTRKKRFFEGIRDLKDRPDALFVIDPKRERNAINEARSMGIPVIALIDSNTDPSDIDLVIPANDDSAKSIRFVVEQIAQGYAAGKQDKGVKPEKATKEEKSGKTVKK